MSGVSVGGSSCCLLSVVGCQALIVDCRVSLSVIVVVSLLSGIGGGVLVVDCRCRLSPTFSIIGAQLCWSDIAPSAPERR